MIDNKEKDGYIYIHEDILKTRIGRNPMCYTILITIALNVDQKSRTWETRQIDFAKTNNISRITLNKYLKMMASDEFDNVISLDFKPRGMVITLNENDFIVL